MLVSLVKMATMLEECTAEEYRSVVRVFFLWAKGLLQTIFIKKCFLFMVGSVCRMKQFTIGSRNCHLGGKCFTDDEEVEEVWKWLRQQSKDFCAAGFDTLVKRWDKCGGYYEK
jgi:hypothetical protein